MNISKLPKWAQDRIKTLERERDIAIRALNEYCDNQTPAPFYSDEMESTGEGMGPSIRRRYIQGYKMSVEHAGVHLDIYTCYGNEISLQWGGANDTGSRVFGDIALIPESFCKARLVAKEHMR